MKKRLVEAETKISSQSAECERLKTELQDEQEKTSYLLSKLEYNLNSSSSISFSTRENKKTDLTEYYNFIYQYKNDCLAASVEYNKSYYDDRDIKPEESIFFKSVNFIKNCKK